MNRGERDPRPERPEDDARMEELFTLDRRRRGAEEGIYRFLLLAGVGGREEADGGQDSRFHRQRELLRGIARDAADEAPESAWEGAGDPGPLLAESLARVAHRNSKGRITAAALEEGRRHLVAASPAGIVRDVGVQGMIPAAEGVEVLPGATFARLLRGALSPDAGEREATARAAEAYEIVLYRLGLAGSTDSADGEWRPRTFEAVAEELACRWSSVLGEIREVFRVRRGGESAAMLDRPVRSWLQGPSGLFAETPAQERFRLECLEQLFWESLRWPVFVSLESLLQHEGGLRFGRRLGEAQAESGLMELADGLLRRWSRARLTWLDAESRLRVADRGYFARAILNRAARATSERDLAEETDARSVGGAEAAASREERPVELRKRAYAAKFAAWAGARPAPDLHLLAMIAASKGLLPWPLEPALERCRDALGEAGADEAKARAPRFAAWLDKARELEERIEASRAALRAIRARVADAARAADGAAWLREKRAEAREALALGDDARSIRRAGEIVRAAAAAAGDAGTSALLGEYWLLASRKPEALPAELRELERALEFARQCYEAALPPAGDGAAPLLARLAAVEFSLKRSREAEANFRRAVDLAGEPFGELGAMIAALRFDTDLGPSDEQEFRETWCAVRAANARWALHPRGGNHRGIQRACEALLEDWRREL